MKRNMKTVLITGCSSGFGLSMVKHFLKKGWRVIATLKNMDTCPNFLKENENKLTLLQLDMTEPNDIHQIKTILSTQFNNHLDCLVNNAGYALIGPLEKISEKKLRRQMEVNFIGPSLLIQACLNALRNGSGKIINISSAMGFVGFPLSSLYCASKFALEGLSESLYYELKPYGVQVGLIEPGWHGSQFFNNLVYTDKSNLANSDKSTLAYSEQLLGIPSNENLYQKQENKLHYYIKQLRNKKAPSPSVVAKKVVKLAMQESIPLRTRIGNDAQFLYYFHKILPKRGAHFLLSKLYNKLLLKAG